MGMLSCGEAMDRITARSISLVVKQPLEAANLHANIVIDCSHANSEKNPALQPAVAQHLGEQIVQGNQSIIGIMLESNLEAGDQAIPRDHRRSAMAYR